MKVWISKYALTQGLQTAIAEGEPTGSTCMISVKDKYGYMYFHGEGKDWHRTPESAVIRAEQIRKRKIASHQKAIKALNELNFAAQTKGNP